MRGSARIYDVRMAQFVLKIEKIVPYHSSARIPGLTVSIPDYGSCKQPVFPLPKAAVIDLVSEVFAVKKRAVDKTRNMEHSGTSRNIPKHLGTWNNYNNYEKNM